MILGLDLAAGRTGWCLLGERGHCHSYGSWRFPKSGPPGKRWVEFLNLLGKLYETTPFLAIAYERVMPNVQSKKTPKGPAGHVYGALLCVVETFACHHDLPLYPVHVSTAKKTAGHGHYTKNQMVEAAQRRWGLTIVNHDEADSLWVAETVRIQHA